MLHRFIALIIVFSSGYFLYKATKKPTRTLIKIIAVLSLIFGILIFQTPVIPIELFYGTPLNPVPPTYPGYKNARKALTFCEKHDQFSIMMGTADDMDGDGPTNGKMLFIMKNTVNGGYTFKHKGKYFYFLERITKWKEWEDEYKYSIDAVPIHSKAKDIPSKYIGIINWKETKHAQEGKGDTYEDFENRTDDDR